VLCECLTGQCPLYLAPVAVQDEEGGIVCRLPFHQLLDLIPQLVLDALPLINHLSQLPVFTLESPDVKLLLVELTEQGMSQVGPTRFALTAGPGAYRRDTGNHPPPPL